MAVTAGSTKNEAPAGFPISDIDLFDAEVLKDSLPAFRELRELGDAAWLPRLGMFAVARYDDVQKALKASDVLVSSEGVTANEALLGEHVRKGPTGVLTQDGERHDELKQLLIAPLMPKSLQDLRGRIEQEAAQIVGEVANGEEFEAVSRLSSYLPTRIVAELVGLKVEAAQLLSWANEAFQTFGPANDEKTIAAMPHVGEFVGYALSLTRDDVVPGGWADRIFQLVEEGRISLDVGRTMIFDYATPSLDTTIAATSEMLWRLATTEGAFDAVKANPELIPGVVNEAVRLSTPIRGFTRYVKEDFPLSESVLPAGSRVFLLYASANRDERRYPNPDSFDITRNPRDQLGWGHGAHFCAGVHLSRLEMEILLGELTRRVSKIECGAPTRMVNNGMQGFKHLPLRLHQA